MKLNRDYILIGSDRTNLLVELFSGIYKELLSQYGGFGILVGEMFKERCLEVSREYFMDLYKERRDINYEEIGIWAMICEDNSLSLRFNNLYSYLFAYGIMVPYNRWIYENQVEVDKKTFIFNAATCRGYLMSTADVQAVTAS